MFMRRFGARQTRDKTKEIMPAARRQTSKKPQIPINFLDTIFGVLEDE
jgi:hypothetical protein